MNPAHHAWQCPRRIDIATTEDTGPAWVHGDCNNLISAKIEQEILTMDRYVSEQEPAAIKTGPWGLMMHFRMPIEMALDEDAAVEFFRARLREAVAQREADKVGG